MSYETIARDIELSSALECWHEICRTGTMAWAEVSLFFQRHLVGANHFDEIYGAVQDSVYFGDFYRDWC